jgi:hypothetical protein
MTHSIELLVNTCEADIDDRLPIKALDKELELDTCHLSTYASIPTDNWCSRESTEEDESSPWTLKVRTTLLLVVFYLLYLFTRPWWETWLCPCYTVFVLDALTLIFMINPTLPCVLRFENYIVMWYTYLSLIRCGEQYFHNNIIIIFICNRDIECYLSNFPGPEIWNLQ